MKTMMFNPYTGRPRDPRDIQSDPAGLLMLDPDEPVRAAARPASTALATELGPDGKEWAITEAGYAHVGKVSARADGFHGLAPWFHGWAVREAFVAGAEWQRARSEGKK